MATITHVTDATSVGLPGGNLTTGSVVNASIGDWLVVILALNYHKSGGGSNFTSITDSDGINVYTVRAQVQWDPPDSPNYAGSELIIATCTVTDALVNASITAHGMTISNAISVYRLQGAGLSFVATDTVGSKGNDTNHSAATVSVALGDVIFGAASIETKSSVTGDTDTVNGSWSTVATAMADADGSETNAQTVASQYKVVTLGGNQSWTCSTTSARDSARSYLVLHASTAAYSLAADQGSYALSGTAATMRIGIAPMVADPGSYALTGTAASPLHGWLLTAAAGSYALTGTAASPFYGRDLAATAGSYLLTGSNVTLTASNNKLVPADPGTYVLTGQDANLLHGWLLAAAAGSYALSGTAASPLVGLKLDATVGGVYLLTGTSVALNAATGNKTLLADPGAYLLTGTNATLAAGFMVAAAPGSYLLTGTAATLQASIPAAPPIRAIGEPPIARDLRRRREAERARALEQQRKARDRLKRAIGRLLEGLPPEFDEPEQLAEAEASAVQAFNLLRAMRAPAPELDAVSELISTIQAMRVAKPIVQLELARAYNHSHRHLKQKATEDVVMTLLLGE